VRGQRHAPAATYPQERPGTHCTGGWVGFRAGLDRYGKSRPTGIRSPDRPVRRQSLYWLSYPSFSLKHFKYFYNFSFLAVWIWLFFSFTKLRTRLYKHTNMVYSFTCVFLKEGRSQWPRGLKCRSSAARLLRWWVGIPPGAWMSVCCEYCVLPGRGLYDGMTTRPEESYRLWRVVVCDQEISNNEEAKARYRAVKIQPQSVVTAGKQHQHF